ncbi:MAG: NAD(P)/FAD-dependent oxidoreductase [Deltaproteobacteria bacterium]|nr:NAD(P)/FAD-dependent oxidoreductase [Deltaproteobacteria bacterium]
MAKQLQCDVLVIGAGPAGSRAAMRAASEGLKVILVDSKTRLGERPHCGEFVPYQIFREFSLNRNSILHKINNLETLIVENKSEFRFKTNLIQSNGFLIDRPKFDRYAAIEAATSGALTMSSTTFSAFADKGCILKSVNGEIIVKSKFVVAADGARSTVRKKLGLLNDDCVVGRQLEGIISNTNSSNAMVFLDHEFFGGYGWLFPKGATANVGVGLLPRDGCMYGDSLENFSEMLIKMCLIKPGWIARTSGFIPTFGIRFPIIVDNIIFVGDAAGLAHPITGAGIAPAVFSGDTAGEFVAKAVKSGNPSIISRYQDAILYRYGGPYQHALSKKKVQLESWETKDFTELCNQTWISFKGYKKRERKN